MVTALTAPATGERLQDVSPWSKRLPWEPAFLSVGVGLIAAAGRRGRVRVMDLEGGEEHDLLTLPGGITGLTFSPDGRHLTLVGPRGFALWRATDGRLITRSTPTPCVRARWMGLGVVAIAEGARSPRTTPTAWRSGPQHLSRQQSPTWPARRADAFWPYPWRAKSAASCRCVVNLSPSIATVAHRTVSLCQSTAAGLCARRIRAQPCCGRRIAGQRRSRSSARKPRAGMLQSSANAGTGWPYRPSATCRSGPSAPEDRHDRLSSLFAYRRWPGAPAQGTCSRRPGPTTPSDCGMPEPKAGGTVTPPSPHGS